MRRKRSVNRMNHVGGVLVLCAVASSSLSATRLAVVDVGPTKPVPPAFFELLDVDLAGRPEIDLLERRGVDRLLREQALGQTLSGPLGPADAVRTGHLLATDAFLLLEGADDDGAGVRTLRVRLVDTRFGLKLWDTSLPIGQEIGNWPDEAAQLSRRVTQRLVKLTCNPHESHLVSVAAFQNQEISKRLDWVSDALATGLEQHIDLEPGVVVVERGRTMPLYEERELARGLPDALQSARTIVRGEFHVNREAGEDVIRVSLRCLRNENAIAEKEMEGSINDLGLLYRRMVDSILAALEARRDCESMDPMAESLHLVREAQEYMRRNEPKRALPLYEAALALVPGDTECEVLFLEALMRHMDAPTSFRRKYRMRALTLAQRILKRRPDYLYRQYRMIGLINRLVKWHTTPAGARKVDPPEVTPEFRDALFTSIRMYRDYDRQRNGGVTQHWLNSAASAIRLHDNLEDALRYARELMDYSLEAGDARPQIGLNIHGLDALQFSLQWRQDLTGWADSSDVVERVIAFMEKATRSGEPRVRYHAHEALALMYMDENGGRRTRPHDYERGRLHVEACISEYKELMKTYSSGNMISTIRRSKFAPELEEHLAIRGKYLRDVFEIRFLPEVQQTQDVIGHQGGLSSLAAGIARQLEREGRLAGAHSILERALETMPRGGGEWENQQITLTRFRRRHPEVTTDSSLRPARPIEVSALFSTDDASTLASDPKWKAGRIHFRRLDREGSSLAVVCSLGLGVDEQCGVLRFDTERLRPHSLVAADHLLRIRSNLANINMEYLVQGPAVAIDEGRVFVGFREDGILAFPEHGHPRIMNEESGLALSRILDLTVWDNTLFAIVGIHRHDTGLMTVNLETEISTLLYSTRSRPGQNPLDGTDLFAVAEDPRRSGVWVLAHSDQPHRFQAMPFLYNPGDQSLRNVEDILGQPGPVLPAYGPFRMEMYGDSLLVWGHTGGVRYDLDTGESAYLYSPTYYADEHQPIWVLHYQHPVSGPMIPFENGLLLLETEEFWLLRNGIAEPANLRDRLTPRERFRNCRFRDLAVTAQGVLLLTDDTLFLLPKLKDLMEPELPGISGKHPALD